MNLHLKVGTGFTPSTLISNGLRICGRGGTRPYLPLIVNRILFQTFVGNLVATFVGYGAPKSLRQRCR